MKLSAMLFLGALAASGCGASTSTYRSTTDRQNYTPIAAEELARPCNSTLRVCVTNPEMIGFKGTALAARTMEIQKLFPSTVRHPAPNPGLCDLGVFFPELWNEAIEVFRVKESPPNEFLARFEAGPVNRVAKALCLALAPGGVLAGKVAANVGGVARTVAPAAAAPAAV